MDKTQLSYERIYLIAVAKLLSDQSTYLQGELHHDLKHDFNCMTRATDRFIKRCEALLSPENIENLQQITDELNAKMSEIRKQVAEM